MLVFRSGTLSPCLSEAFVLQICAVELLSLFRQDCGTGEPSAPPRLRLHRYAVLLGRWSARERFQNAPRPVV